MIFFIISTTIIRDCRLADDLLSEVVDQVADELGELCDGYVDRLFSSEFVKPPSHSPTPSND